MTKQTEQPFNSDFIRELLEEKYQKYNNPVFIDTDPISIPHLFSQKVNIEVSAFLTAAISWGNRISILKNSKRLMSLMDNNPYEFIRNAGRKDYLSLSGFCHRTFNSDDAVHFVLALSHIYKNYNGLEGLFTKEYLKSNDIRQCLISFRKVFFEMPHKNHPEKHIADVSKGASAKRLNMFLRWMVRKDSNGVDFGIWKNIDPSSLYIPLDIHTGKTARSLGLLGRRTNDWKAVEELTENLRSFDPVDPVRYDFALFGMGVFDDMSF